MKKCRKCGFECPDEAVFCPVCGKKNFETGVIEKKKAPRLFLLLCSILTFFIIIVVVIFSCFVPVNRMISNLKQGDGETASNIYFSQISGNVIKEKWARKGYVDFVENIKDEFENKDIEYDEAERKLNAAGYIVLDDSFYECRDAVGIMNSARKGFQDAEDAFEKEKYEEALVNYRNVIALENENAEEASKKLEVCIEKYREQVLYKYHKYLQEGNYESAYQVLEYAANYLHDDIELSQTMAEHDKLVQETELQNIIERAEEYANNSDYKEALQVINEKLESDSDNGYLEEEREDLKKRYETHVINSAKEAFQEENYEKAYNLVSAGLEYVESKELEKLHEIYKSYIPVKLGDMEIFQNKSKGGMYASFTNKVDSYNEDSYGNTYSNSFFCGKGSIQYLVNFEFQTFSGVVACPKGETYDEFRTSATLKIYGDDSVIAEFKDYNLESKAKAFELDISSYEKISLVWECKGMNIWEDWGQFATIFDGMFTPIRKKIL